MLSRQRGAVDGADQCAVIAWLAAYRPQFRSAMSAQRLVVLGCRARRLSNTARESSLRC